MGVGRRGDLELGWKGNRVRRGKGMGVGGRGK